MLCRFAAHKRESAYCADLLQRLSVYVIYLHVLLKISKICLNPEMLVYGSVSGETLFAEFSTQNSS